MRVEGYIYASKGLDTVSSIFFLAYHTLSNEQQLGRTGIGLGVFTFCFVIRAMHITRYVQLGSQAPAYKDS